MENVTNGGSLDAIGESIRPGKATTIKIDVTRFVKHERGQRVVLEWKSPSIQSLYMVASDADILQRRYPLWPERLAFDVATVAACHAQPSSGTTPIGLFYAQIILKENAEMWQFLMSEISRVFPHLRYTSSESTDELLELCAEFYGRHPDELAHLSSDAVIRMRGVSEKKAARAASIGGSY